jgi:hypothetical protein
MICRCVFDLTQQPPTVDASHCDHPDHREDAAAYWNALPGLRRANLVNAPGGAT